MTLNLEIDRLNKKVGNLESELQFKDDEITRLIEELSELHASKIKDDEIDETSFMTPKEAAARLSLRLEEGDALDKQVYVKEGTIIVDVEYEYEIDFKDCRDYRQILRWVLQLSDKTWITAPVLERFILTALDESNLKHPAA